MNSSIINDDRPMLILQCDLALNLVLIFFLLIGQGSANESHVKGKAQTDGARLADESRIRLLLGDNGRMMLADKGRNTTTTLDSLPALLRERGVDPQTLQSVVLAYPAQITAGEVHEKLRELADRFPAAEVKQVVQSQSVE